MANQNSSERKPGFRRPRSRYFSRRKVCAFCVNHVTTIDYKNVSALERYVSDRFKIESRRKSGACSKHQRLLARAIKRARHVGMLPFTSDHKFGGLSAV